MTSSTTCLGRGFTACRPDRRDCGAQNNARRQRLREFEGGRVIGAPRGFYVTVGRGIRGRGVGSRIVLVSVPRPVGVADSPSMSPSASSTCQPNVTANSTAHGVPYRLGYVSARTDNGCGSRCPDRHVARVRGDLQSDDHRRVRHRTKDRVTDDLEVWRGRHRPTLQNDGRRLPSSRALQPMMADVLARIISGLLGRPNSEYYVRVYIDLGG
jgi:hypothetical protein